MKIAVWYNLPSGGAKRALYYHMRGLVERGHHVEVWTTSTADRNYLPLSEFAEEHVLPFDERGGRSRGPLSRPFRTYHWTVDKMAGMEAHCEQCAGQIRERGFDLLFANTCYDYAAAAIGRHVDLPKALYVQEPHRPLYEAGGGQSPWAARLSAANSWRSPGNWKSTFSDILHVQAQRIRVRQEMLNAAAYDVLLVNSYFSRESILRAYGLDAKVCYLGIDTGLFTDQKQSRENFVVGLGQVSAHKNPKFIIEAVAAMAEPRPRLIWIGNAATASYPEELKQLARERGVEFELRVNVSNEELNGLLNRAKLMLYAPRLEPFGFAPLEGNACGLPVVAVAEGGVRETVIDGVNGLLVENTPEAMASAASRLLNDPAYAAHIGEEGRRIVQERWSLPTSINRLEKELAAIVPQYAPV